jgi:hypothetical protein
MSAYKKEIWEYISEEGKWAKIDADRNRLTTFQRER